MQRFLNSKQLVEAKRLDRQYEDKIAGETQNEIEYGGSETTLKTNLTPIVSVH
jgi:hypothetical protein